MKHNDLTAVLDVTHRRVVCVGAGPVAVRKLRKVMGRAQTVIVIAPTAEPTIRDWHEAGQLIWYPRTFAADDVQQGDIVISAAGAQVSALVKTAAHAKGAWLNDAVNAAEGDLMLPANWESGSLTGTVTSQGAMPRLVALLTRDLEKQYADIGAFAAELAPLRQKVRELLPQSAERQAFWRTYLPDDTLERIRRGEKEIIKGEILHAIGRLGAES